MKTVYRKNNGSFRMGIIIFIMATLSFPLKATSQIRWSFSNADDGPIREARVTSSNGGIEYHTTKKISANGEVSAITPQNQETYYFKFSGNYIFMNNNNERYASAYKYDHSENGKSLYYDVKRYTKRQDKIRYWYVLMVSSDKNTINRFWLDNDRECTDGLVFKLGPKEKSKIIMYE